MRRIALVIALCAPMLAAPAAAQVIVNGKALNPSGIAWLAELSCGPVYPGSYWLDNATGYWGYAGSSRVEGHIRDRCQRRPSLSERRQLYRPGEILSGN